eukprot:GHVP01038086.1.p1 GENE.GHVP01038086.1~~GHVP01038086.1.p1  ORF type:complete len:759 (+),score=122.90 GHVP01038086.1:27-2303(+)
MSVGYLYSEDSLPNISYLCCIIHNHLANSRRIRGESKTTPIQMSSWATYSLENETSSSDKIDNVGICVDSTLHEFSDFGAVRFISSLGLTHPSPSSSGASLSEALECTAWLTWLESESSNINQRDFLSLLDKHLTFRTYLVGRTLTTADLAVLVILGKTANFKFNGGIFNKFPHAKRYFNYLAETPEISAALKEMQSFVMARAESSFDKKEESTSTGLCLPGAVEGQVVTRFPPEPSGYLHIGHAKAALVNAYFAKKYKGELIVRFDDTNPQKEKLEYQESILEDLKLLDIEPQRITATSDYFEIILKYAEKLIIKGLAYVDDTPVEKMREWRTAGVPSPCRRNSREENMALWKEMVLGTERGTECCLRASIDPTCKNKCMRDPVLYRVMLGQTHHRTGTTYKVYPTYDFSCPIVDSIEGVTHAMRSNEYADRIAQYNWVIEACELRPVQIYEFSRLNFVNTLLSKRKLQWFVDNNVVDGWSDPRFPTVRGLIRRGMTVKALLDFMLDQGASKNSNLMEWGAIWTKNKQFLDPIVPRYMAVAEDAVPLHLTNGPEMEEITRPLHQKNPSLGECTQFLHKDLLIEMDDAEALAVSEEFTLKNWGNAIIEELVRNDAGALIKVVARLHLEGDFKTTKKKLHWIVDTNACLDKEGNAMKPFCFVIREFDHLITKKKPEETDELVTIFNPKSVFDTVAIGDPNMATLKEGDFLQLERRGYFRVDMAVAHNIQMTLIKIPGGKTREMSKITSKVDAEKLSKGK